MTKKKMIAGISILVFFFGCYETKANKDIYVVENTKQLFPIGNFHEKIGFIDLNGQLIIPKQYYYGGGEGIFHEGLVGVIIDGKDGYMDEEGRIIISAIYDEYSAHPFSEGLASVAIGEKSGYINKKGEVVIDFKYLAASDFNDGLAFVMRSDRKKQIINQKDEVIAVIPDSEDIAPVSGFINGYAIMRKEDPEAKYGIAYVDAYIGKDGKYLTDFLYSDATSFTKEGYASVFYRDGGEFKRILIDRTGKTAFTELGLYNVLGEYDQGFISVGIGLIKKARWGVLDADGKWVVQPQFREMTAVREGLFGFRREADEKWGVMNVKGEVVAVPAYGTVMPFSDGMALVSFDDLRTLPEVKPGGVPVLMTCGFINSKGELAIPPKYAINPRNFENCYFRNGLAKISNEYINKQGKVVYTDH